MIISFTDSLMRFHGETIYDYTESSIISKIIAYTINSKYRNSVKLSKWLNDQLNQPTEQLLKLARSIKTYQSYDSQISAILRYITFNFTYIGDSKSTWKMMEYWQTANESVETMMGDCEDGAILMYILARLKGIPANRLMLFAGTVQSSPTAATGGHCWLGYKPKNHPFNFVFMDWCYYYDSKDVPGRPLYWITKEIKKFRKISNDYYFTDKNKYIKIWFGFNEKIGVTKYEPNNDE